MRKGYRKEIKWFLIIGFFLFSLDRFSKIWAYHFFAPSQAWENFSFPYGGIKVFQNFLGIDFCLNKVMNPGGAWGLLGSYPLILMPIRLLILFGIIFYFFFGHRESKKTFPLLLIIIGALSNILDYFFYGAVIDLFHFILWGYSFPVFNIADISIFFGIMQLMIKSLMQKKSQKETKHGISHQSSPY